MSDYLVKVSGIVKKYGGHEVLKKVSFDLKPGEVHCIVGENGAGKSTLIKIISGAVHPDSGEIFIMGRKVRNLNPRLAIELGISTVYQDTEVVDTLSVAENIFLGSEVPSPIPIVVNRRYQNEQAKAILKSLGISIDPDIPVGELPLVYKQVVQIAKALFRQSKIIIFDEPTASLGLEETKALMEIIRSLKKRGMGIIYISHYLKEIFEIGDRVTVLKDGEYMGTYKVSEVDTEFLVRKMVGREVHLFYKRERVPIGEKLFEVKGLSKKELVENVSFEVRKGEIFGIGGLAGSGRTELVSLIFGILKPDAGEIYIEGRRYVPKTPIHAIRNGICMVPEDRKRMAMFLGRDIVENSVVIINELLKVAFLRKKEEMNMTRRLINELDIVTSGFSQLIEHLSGGNQQKVVMGRWLLDENAKVFIFDEPTKGVDVGARERIYQVMIELAKQGKAIIMVSSDMPELLSMSDRIGVMRKGKMVEILDNKDLSEEKLLRSFIGV